MARYICGDDGTARRQLDEIEAMESVLGMCRAFEAPAPLFRYPHSVSPAALRCPPTSLLSVTKSAGPAKVEVETGLRERLLAAAAAVPESAYFDSAPPGRLQLEVSAADGAVGVVGQLTLTLPPRCGPCPPSPQPKNVWGGVGGGMPWSYCYYYLLFLSCRPPSLFPLREHGAPRYPLALPKLSVSSAGLSKKAVAAITGTLEPLAQELTADGDECIFQLVTELAQLLGAAAVDEPRTAATEPAGATAGPASPKTGHAQFCRELTPTTVFPLPPRPPPYPPSPAPCHPSVGACAAVSGVGTGGGLGPRARLNGTERRKRQRKRVRV